MRYIKIETILPDHLIEEIQKYVQGEYIYVPTKRAARKRWGEKSGSRSYLKSRNKDICYKYSNGVSYGDLAKEFFLSVESIKKIIYSKSK